MHTVVGVCHRDIKPDNNMISKRTDFLGKTIYRVKICDYNVAKRFIGDKTMMTKTGIEQWQAPEMEGRKKYSEKVDTWSAGCVLYFALTGYCPFNSTNYAKMMS